MEKKLLIAHRGNYCGRLKNHENHPDYVMRTLDLGFDVEIDIWAIEGQLFLGHDKPQYPIEKSFLSDPRLWIHCKNLQAMEILSNDSSLNIFAHKKGIVITTAGYLWSAPGEPLTKKSIAVMPELAPDWDIKDACGVCSDYVMKYKQ